ncbi:MAG: hypothetical protein ACK56I_19535, partial [bacterium]
MERLCEHVGNIHGDCLHPEKRRMVPRAPTASVSSIEFPSYGMQPWIVSDRFGSDAGRCPSWCRADSWSIVWQPFA